MKSKAAVLASGWLLLFSGCRDVLFNNPLDPNASTEVLQIEKIMTTTLANDGDITFDGEKFWKVNVVGGLIAFDVETGTTIRTIGGVSGTGVAVTQDRIFVCSGDNLIYSLDPLSGDIIDRIATVDIYPGFMASMDDHLLIYDLRSFAFYDYEPNSGEVQFLFQVTGVDLAGLEFYEGGILFVDRNSNSIFHYTLEGELISAYRSPASDTGGISVDASNNIYLLTLNGQLYKVSVP